MAPITDSGTWVPPGPSAHTTGLPPWRRSSAGNSERIAMGSSRTVWAFRFVSLNVTGRRRPVGCSDLFRLFDFQLVTGFGEIFSANEQLGSSEFQAGVGAPGIVGLYESPDTNRFEVRSGDVCLDSTEEGPYFDRRIGIHTFDGNPRAALPTAETS